MKIAEGYASTRLDLQSSSDSFFLHFSFYCVPFYWRETTAGSVHKKFISQPNVRRRVIMFQKKLFLKNKSIFVAGTIERAKLHFAYVSRSFMRAFSDVFSDVQTQIIPKRFLLRSDLAIVTFLLLLTMEMSRRRRAEVRSRTHSNTVTVIVTFTRDGGRSLRLPPFKTVSWMGHPVEPNRRTGKRETWAIQGNTDKTLGSPLHWPSTMSLFLRSLRSNPLAKCRQQDMAKEVPYNFVANFI